MPNYLDVIDSNKFWEDTPDSDLFSLTVLAAALGVGRNKMSKLPVKRYMFDKRVYYKKGDVLDWASSEQGKDLLLSLRAENSSIGRAEKSRSKYYDYQLSKDYKSHYNPRNGKKETNKDLYHRLKKEWGGDHHSSRRDGIIHQLINCNDNTELEKLIPLAHSYREKFISLRMGLPSGTGLNNWWFAGDFDAILKARLICKRDNLKRDINYNQKDLNDWIKNGLPSYLMIPNNVDKVAFTNEWINDLELEIKSLKTELLSLES
ncbi:MAG: hypothetical protein V4629_05500 [Pseudomonadota bacterium]